VGRLSYKHTTPKGSNIKIIPFNPDASLGLGLWFVVRQAHYDVAHHDGHLRCLRSLQPELVEGKKQRWKILMRNLG
jgi:hypothetical protein